MSTDRTISICLKDRVLLSSPDSEKQAYHLVFELVGGKCDYLPGDSLGIYPKNNELDVMRVLSHFSWSPDVELSSGVSYMQALTDVYCITHLTPALVEHIHQTISVMDVEKWKDIEHRYPGEINNLSLPDIVELFPSCHISADFLFNNLKKLRPRLYSIASSRSCVGDSCIDLAVVMVQYRTDMGRQRQGVSTRYLCYDASIGEQMTAMLYSSKFKLPVDETRDVIMVGPGTGIAPFRSFLQERVYQRQQLGKDVGRNWLFFGGQKQAHNFYYRSELMHLVSADCLRLDVAFSRDQEERIYVQHRMLEHRQELWSWIRDGACIYICGDAKYMAKDVENVLLQIIAQDGGIDRPDEYLRDMKDSGRYQKDVY